MGKLYRKAAREVWKLLTSKALHKARASEDQSLMQVGTDDDDLSESYNDNLVVLGGHSIFAANTLLFVAIVIDAIKEVSGAKIPHFIVQTILFFSNCNLLIGFTQVFMYICNLWRLGASGGVVMESMPGIVLKLYGAAMLNLQTFEHALRLGEMDQKEEGYLAKDATISLAVGNLIDLCRLMEDYDLDPFTTPLEAYTNVSWWAQFFVTMGLLCLLASGSGVPTSPNKGPLHPKKNLVLKVLGGFGLFLGALLYEPFVNEPLSSASTAVTRRLFSMVSTARNAAINVAANQAMHAAAASMVAH